MSIDFSNKKRSTRLAHLGMAVCDEQTILAPVSMPVVRTSTVVFNTVEALHEAEAQKARGERATVYGRYGLCTRNALEDVFCELEGGERCFLAPSGLSAITTAILSLVKHGDHLICSDGVYGPVRIFAQRILHKMGVEVDFVDLTKPEVLLQHIKPNTVGLYLEAPSSLFLRMLDLPALSKLAHEHNLWVMADNCWGSGVAYRPLDLGADISVLAGTKYVNGHSDLLIGAIVLKDETHVQAMNTGHYALGVSVSADDAWLTTRGARTIELRMKQQAQNALEVIAALEQMPEVLTIYHPAYEKDPDHALWKRDATGSNGLMTIELALTPEQMCVFTNSLELFSIGFSWGGYECLIQWVETEAAKNHAFWQDRGQQVARLHIGLESPQDVIADLKQALQKALSV